MGADMHGHIEIKLNGEWHHYAVVYPRRTYAVFAKIAGVRNYDATFEPIVRGVRGFPDDAHLVTRTAYIAWGDTAHTPGWLTWNELDELARWYDKTFNVDIPPTEHTDLAYWLTCGGSLSPPGGGGWVIADEAVRRELKRRLKIENIRLVFWFDN